MIHAKLAYLAEYAKWQVPNCTLNKTCKMTHAKLHILLNIDRLLLFDNASI